MNRIAYDDIQVCISELHLFLLSILRQIHRKFGPDTSSGTLLPSSLQQTRKWILKVRQNIFSIAYIIIKPFLYSPKPLCHYIRTLQTHQVELLNTDHLEEVLGINSQNNEKLKANDAIKQILAPTDLMPLLFHAMENLETQYNIFFQSSSMSKSDSKGKHHRSNLDPIKVILSILFHDVSYAVNPVRAAPPFQIKSHIKASMVSSLLPVATKVSNFLSPTHWQSLNQIICYHMKEDGSEIKSKDTKEFIQASDYLLLIQKCSNIILSSLNSIQWDLKSAFAPYMKGLSSEPFFDSDFARNPLHNENHNETKVSISLSPYSRFPLESLIVKLYHRAALCNCCKTLETVEKYFRTTFNYYTHPHFTSLLLHFMEYHARFSSIPSSANTINVNSFSNETPEDHLRHIPKWVFVNVLLLVFRSHKGSRRVFRLTSSTTGMVSNSLDPFRRILFLLVGFSTDSLSTNGTEDVHTFLKLLDNGDKWKSSDDYFPHILLFSHLMKNINFDRNTCQVSIENQIGSFYHTSLCLCETASKYTELVYRCISSGSTFTQGVKSNAPYLCNCESSEIGSAWVQVAFEILSTNHIMETLDATILAILALVCVFFNIKSFRHKIVHKTVAELNSENGGEKLKKQLKYCTLCEILIATVARNPNFTSKASLREGDSCVDDMNSLFRPLSCLLSGPSFLSFHPLIRKKLLQALLPLSSARTNLLRFVRTCLKPSFAGANFAFRITNNLGYGNIKRIDHALLSLCSVFGTIYREDESKDTSISIIQDFILSEDEKETSSRAFLLKQLVIMTSSSEIENSFHLSSRTCKALLRSCVIILLRLFVLEHSLEEDLFCSECKVDGIYWQNVQDSLTFLPQRCCKYVIKKDPSGDNFEIRADIIAAIKLCIVLHKRLHEAIDSTEINLTPTYQKLLLQFSRKKPLENLSESSHEDALSNISSLCIFKILIYSLNEKQEHFPRNSSFIECFFMRKLLDKGKLNDIDKTDYKLVAMTKDSSFNPSNLRKMRSLLQPPLCDLFRSALLDFESYSRVSNEYMHEWNQFCSLYFSLNPNHTSEREIEGNNERMSYISIQSNIYGSLLSSVSFLRKSSKAPLSIICQTFEARTSCNIIQEMSFNCRVISEILSPTLEKTSHEKVIACDASLHIYSLFQKTNFFDIIWSVYMSMGSEEQLSTTVEFMESNSAVLSYQGISVSIDSIIRGLRKNILDLLSLVIDLQLRHCLSMHHLLKQVRQNIAVDNPNPSLGLCFEMIRILSNDLSKGLKGHSGAISVDLYTIFMRTIDKVISFATLSLEQEKIDLDYEVIIGNCRICEDASCTLWKILCTYDLKQSDVLKNTLKLALSTLPLLSQRMLRKSGVHEKELEPLMNQSLAVRASSQCVDILHEWFNNNATKCDRNISSWKEFNLCEYKSSLQSKLFGIVEQSNQAKMKSAKVWSFILNSSFTAIEKNWMESKILIQCNLNRDTTPQILSENYLAKFCANRMKELSSTLIVQVVTLGYVNNSQMSMLIPEKKNRTRKENVDRFKNPLYAELLPEQTKVHFMKCLDQVSVTLKISTQCVISSIREKMPSKKFTEKLLESLICLGALLKSSDDLIEQNIASGSRLWNSIEKLKHSFLSKTSKAGENHTKDTPILSQLPKLIFRMEALEIAIQNLLDVVITEKESNLMEYDVLLSVIMEREPEEGIMLQLLQLFIKRSSSIKAHGMTLILDLKKCEKIKNFNGPIPKSSVRITPKRRRSDNHRWKRKILRSRNEVVDQWLELDRNLVADDNEEDDAFVDLEDFLEVG